MRISTLIGRGARHHWRTHLGVVLGVMCATAVLVGALAVGDSVRSSLRRQALDSVGTVHAALSVQERTFSMALADRIAAELTAEPTGTIVAPVLRFAGVANRPAGGGRTGIVEVFGIDQRFCALAPQPDLAVVPAPGAVWLSRRLAGHLGVVVGDRLVLRVQTPSPVPRDAVVASIEDISTGLAVEVGGVLDDAGFGRFGLTASQVPPFDAFVELGWLQTRFGLERRANMLLVGGPNVGVDWLARSQAALRAHWTLDDAELDLRPDAAAGIFELRTDRVFLDRPVVDAVAAIVPGSVAVLTYFVNAIRHGERSTPYSMVAAVGTTADRVADVPALTDLAALAPGSLEGIVINRWLAEDLGIDDAAVIAGDQVELEYFVMGPQQSLATRQHRFTVTGITPLAGAAADPGLMPQIPGLADRRTCAEWDPGMPVSLDALRDQDEAYWEQHAGTPKAFIALATGRELWGDRFGTATAVRGPLAAIERVTAELPRRLDPAALGLFFTDVRTSALAAASPATDFGGLFLGLSFFLLLAAAILTALLFAFGVEQRSWEIGVLLAVGFRPRDVRRMFLGEALLLATIGAVPGAAAGAGYAAAVLAGLGTLWRDAVGETSLTFHVGAGTLIGGSIGAIVVALVAIAVGLRRAFARPALILLRGGGEDLSAGPHRDGRPFLRLIVVAACLLGAIVMVVTALGGDAQRSSSTFFGAGALLLVGGIVAAHTLLARVGGISRVPIRSVAGLGVRNSGRRPGRSVATVGLLASGTFLVVAIEANRLEPPSDHSARESGTGGFALFGRSTLPVLRDPASAAGREAYGLDDAALAGVAIVPLRVRDGDDASCLNLATPQNPRLIGVLPAAFAERIAFQFVASLPPPGAQSPASPWSLLDADYGADVVPAIGDAASVTWAMHKQLGDDLPYRDEQGREFVVRIVATVADSILQGSLVVSESKFEQRFPSSSGYRMFLIDAPVVGIERVRDELGDAFADVGLELTSTTARLREFHRVQNTYLLIFQALGGLGLLLGTLGLAIVVLRNALERRAELAVAQAVGYSRAAVRRLVWSEHALLLALGLGLGAGAALVAVLPGLRSSGPSPQTAVLIVAVAITGSAAVALATRLATRGPLLDALRAR